MKGSRNVPTPEPMTLPQPFTIASVAPTLAVLKSMTVEEQAMLLLRRLVQIYPTVRKVDKFKKSNILLPNDNWQIASGYSAPENMAVRQHLLGGPWNWLVVHGYLVDPSDQGFHDITPEGFAASEAAAKPKPVPITQQPPQPEKVAEFERPGGSETKTTDLQKEGHHPTPSSVPQNDRVGKWVAWSTIIVVPLTIIGILVAVFPTETHDYVVALLHLKPPRKELPNNQGRNNNTPPAPAPKFGRVWVTREVQITPDPEQRDPSDPQNKMRFKTGEENYDAVYDISQSQFPELNIDGPVIYTSCSFNQAFYHMTLCTPVSNQFHCHAHKGRSDTRSFWYITVKYLSPKERCFANCEGGPPTPFPDEDDPNNYSFNVSQSLNNQERGCTWQARKVR